MKETEADTNKQKEKKKQINRKKFQVHTLEDLIL